MSLCVLKASCDTRMLQLFIQCRPSVDLSSYHGRSYFASFFLLFFPWRGRVDLMRQFIEPPRVILPLTIHMMLTYMALLRIGSAHSNVGAFFCDY